MDELRGLLQIALTFAAGALLILAVALLGRRLAGGPAETLSFGGCLVAGVLMSAGLIALRRGWLSATEPPFDATVLVVGFCFPSLAAVFIGSAIAGIEAGPAALGYWGLLLPTEVGLWMTYHRHSQTVAEPPSEPANLPRLFDQAAEDLAEEASEAAEFPANAVQHWLRVAEDGREVIAGSLRGVATGGERSLSLHIAFCPPLESRPEIVAELICESPGSVSVGQAEVYGARFDVKFSGAASAGLEAIVEFEAVASFRT